MTDKLKIRRRERLSAEAAHELKVIDDALVGLHTETPDDAAITDFAMRLRSARPTADADVYGRLDARFAERIEQERVKNVAAAGKGPSAFDRFIHRALRPAPLVGAMAALMIGVTAVSLVSGGQYGPSGLSSLLTSDAVVREASAVSRPASRRGDSATAGDPRLRSGSSESTKSLAIDEAPMATTQSNPGARRKIESSGDLVLAASSDKVEDVADEVISMTDRFDGYVRNSSITGGDAAKARARFDLQFPATRYQQALAQLSGLAHVRSRTQTTQDITDPYSRARDRLSAARTERDRLRAKLAATVSETEAKALRARVRIAERRVNARASDSKRMRNRVNYVSLSLAIVADDSAAADDRGTIAHAVATARDVLTYFVAVGLVALAIALPLTLIAVLAVFTTRGIRRRRNDVAIAGASMAGDSPPV